MRAEIVAYFNRIEQRLLESRVVTGYTVMRCEITPVDGKVRIRAHLVDGGLLELFEYVTLKEGGHIVRQKYSYHWQGADGLLIRRWDAVAHHPELPYAPHHIHLPDGGVEGVARPPDIAEVLSRIESAIGDNG